MFHETKNHVVQLWGISRMGRERQEQEAEDADDAAAWGEEDEDEAEGGCAAMQQWKGACKGKKGPEQDPSPR